MPASIVLAPIAEGRLDEWRAFHEELTGARRGEWAESQRRRGVAREAVFLWSGPDGPVAVYLVEGTEAGEALGALAGSTHPFDEWLRERFDGLHASLDFPVAMSDTRPRPESWRGWRGLRRGSGGG
ncbi:MAG: hypothetical protein KQH83_04585 [Actinobacteria bacterium]|nr:hypothetical protein [Actinomycetota bacterium]